MIFDTHIHLNDKKIYENLDFYIQDALNRGVKKFLCVGYDLESSKIAIEIANKYHEVYASIGIIPTEYKQYNDDSINNLRKLMDKSNKIVAIGEIGLDYYWEKEESVRTLQKKIFIEQIELANELNLPISIHCRDAYKDTLDILKEHKIGYKIIANDKWTTRGKIPQYDLIVSIYISQKDYVLIKYLFEPEKEVEYDEYDVENHRITKIINLMYNIFINLICFTIGFTFLILSIQLIIKDITTSIIFIIIGGGVIIFRIKKIAKLINNKFTKRL